MSKVTGACLRMARKTNNKALAVKLALLANIENNNNGVFIDNAYSEIHDFVTPNEFAGYLSALTKIGFYEPSQDTEYKGKYGYILINPE